MRNPHMLLLSNPTDRVLDDVLRERWRHDHIGYTIERDNEQTPESLVGFAINYVEADGEPGKIMSKLDREELIKSISVMVAAVELMDRKQ